MKLSPKTILLFSILALASQLSGCGTWVGSPGEEDDETNYNQDDPKASEAGTPSPLPVSDGVFEIQTLPESESVVECTDYELSYSVSPSDNGRIYLQNDSADLGTSLFTVTSPDTSTTNTTEITLSQTGSYRILDTHTNGSEVTSCVLYLNLLQINSDESYDLIFTHQ